MMSKKAASWTAAGLTLFVTLLLGAVLIRPVLTLSQDDRAGTSDGSTTTIVQDSAPVFDDYDDDDYYEDDDDYDDEHEDDDYDDDDRYDDDDDEDHDDD